MLTALVALAAIVALVVQAHVARRALRSAVALERARQDLLLNRLASRTPAEFAAYAQTGPEIVAPLAPANAPKVRHLYDQTGLVHVEISDDDDVEAAV